MSSRALLLSLAPLAFTACLPPAYEPADGEEMFTIADVEHWKRAAPEPAHDQGVAAVITWRLGEDAPLPHAFPVGNCLVTEGNWSATEFSPPSHGALTFSGSKKGDVDVGYHRNEAGANVGYDQWDDGANLSIRAAGDSLPAFDVGGAMAPQIELTSHDLAGAAAGEIKISRTEPFELTWAAGTGEVAFLVMQFDDDPETSYFHSAWCHFPAEDGAATVPVDVLGTFVAQSEINFSDVYAGSLVRETKQVEDTTVELWNWNARGARVEWE